MDKEIKSRLKADYERIRENKFWNLYQDNISRIRSEIVNLIVTAPDYNHVLMEQGMIRAIDRLMDLPEKLANELGK